MSPVSRGILSRSQIRRGKIMDAVYNREPEKLKYWDYSNERNTQSLGYKLLTAAFFLSFYIDSRHDTRNSGIATRIFGHASFF